MHLLYMYTFCDEVFIVLPVLVTLHKTTHTIVIAVFHLSMWPLSRYEGTGRSLSLKLINQLRKQNSAMASAGKATSKDLSAPTTSGLSPPRFSEETRAEDT